MANILVVDDHVDTCRVMVRLLRHLHYDSACVHSGEAALSYVRSNLPDLVILDVMMPGMDGMEVLRSLRSEDRTAKVPVIMFSAVTDSSFREHAITKGATDYWAKAGLDFETLADRLHQILFPGGTPPIAH